MKLRRHARSVGFTLIEVLVALAIVATALVAALRAVGQGTSSVETMRSRLLAGWVAENVLASHRAEGDWLPLGSHNGTQHQGSQEFRWREDVVTTPNPSFRRVDVFVFSPTEESHILAHLTGFVVSPPRAPQ